MTTHTDRLRIITDEIMALPDPLRLGVALVRLTGAEVEIERLRAALEHYANTENWRVSDEDHEWEDWWMPIREHGYTRAKKALEGGEG